MRVALISYEFPPDTALGGIATYVSQIARGLISYCVDVEVFCGSLTRSDTFTQGGVRVHRIQSDRTAFPTAVLPVFQQRHTTCPFSVVEGPDFMAEANAVVNAAPEIPYVVKLHTPYYLAKRLNKGRVTLARIHEQLRLLWYVLRTHNFRALLPQDREIFIREGRNLRRADEVMAPSRAIVRAIRNTWIINPSRISLVPLVFEPPPELLEIPIETNTRCVTFVGRLERRKGVEDLAHAIPLVLSVLPDTRFRFVGGNADEGTEEKILHRVPHNLRSQIEFTGAVPPAAVPRYLADTDICVFPSRWESFGFVALEAMSAGRAVICTTMRACGSRSGGKRGFRGCNATAQLPLLRFRFDLTSVRSLAKYQKAKVGTTRRVVRERCLPPAHIQPDGPAVRPYHPNDEAYVRLRRNSIKRPRYCLKWSRRIEKVKNEAARGLFLCS